MESWEHVKERENCAIETNCMRCSELGEGFLLVENEFT